MPDSRSESTSSAETARAEAPAGTVLGRYTLHDAIASGGMATVHLGRLRGSVGFSRVVAIKRIHPHIAREPDFVAMFLDEARLASRVRHPNVVSVLDVAATSAEVFLVMEYIVGESLAVLQRSLGASNERVPLPFAVHVMCDVLHGLHAAHEANDEHRQRLGLVHRDVSPQNILVGTDGVARIVDFGVAKAAGRLHTTRSGQLKGKLGYMAPEQIRGERVAPTADVYSAGVTLWELLTGRRMIDADSEAELVLKSLSADIPAPHEVDATVPEALSRAVQRAIEKRPADRYPTALAFLEALEAAAGLVSARHVGEWVGRVAAAGLSERVAIVQRVESQPLPVSVAPAASSSANVMASTSTKALPAAERRPTFNIAWFALVAVAAVLGWVLLRGPRQLEPQPGTAAAPALSPARVTATGTAATVGVVAPSPAVGGEPLAPAPSGSGANATLADTPQAARSPKRAVSATPSPSASTERKGGKVPDDLLGRF